MIDTLLIANRGEIACRIIATAHRLGIRTVAVYSDADAGARHVEMADEAMRIGAAPVSESYLRADAILAAAKASSADAIHPGYGFLSENPDFAEAVAAAGLVFVGPPASAIRAMGLKDAAKTLMEGAKVPVVPGYHGDRQDPDFLAGEADQIGYPVLIKARAGGGGKGMRLVETAEEFDEALAAAQREGQASFGDPAVLVEKFITTPRHIEIQIFADTHGNVVNLFERDCSLQRRHQKVIEEAPAPGMPDDVRAVMGAAAVEAARTIGYVGAGTVEFIADGSGPLRADGFWFMEMNTRLQVEHPVTEAITGLDLVEHQLRVAAGEPLPFTQDALAIDGHAFEARIYAEDAEAGFLPATGRLTHLSFPESRVFDRHVVRVDSGVREGDEITPHYDPMIAKLIVHGPDRRTALRKLSAALAETRIAGTVTNIGFLKRLADHAGFSSGEIDTGLITRDMDALTKRDPETFRRAVRVAALASLGLPECGRASDPWNLRNGWRIWGSAVHRTTLMSAGERFEVTIEVGQGNLFNVAGHEIRATRTKDGLRISDGDIETEVGVFLAEQAVAVFDCGMITVFERIDPLDRAADAVGGGNVVLAPMPGLVTEVHAKPGAAVEAGSALLVLEAMKMEHTLRAPRAGRVVEVTALKGAQVQNGAVLVRLEDEDG